MKTFVLIVTFSATTGLIGGGRIERVASFDDYQSCVSAGQTLYPLSIGNACRRTSRKDALAAGSRFRPQGSPTGRPFTCGDL